MARILTCRDEKEIAQHYRDGKSTSEIARLFGKSYGCIWKALKRNKISKRSNSEGQKLKPRKLQLDESAFDFIDERSAYWVGFLMADGNIHRTKFCSPIIQLALAAKDKKHIEKFKNFLKSQHKIVSIPKKNGAQLSIRSEKLVKALKQFGVVANKSFSAKVNYLEFNRHFWRGVIDGDGCIGVYNGQTILHLAGSQELLTQFKNYVRFICPDSRANVNKLRSIKQIRIVRQAAKLIENLYSDCSVSLDRKLKKAREIIHGGR